MLICVCVTQELVLQETAKIQREVVGRVKGQSASAGIVYKVDSTSQPAPCCDSRTGCLLRFQGTPKNLVIHVTTMCALVLTCKYW